MRVLAATLLALCALEAAPPLARTIDALVESSKAAKQAFWGIRVVDLKNGAVIYRRNEKRFFVPASNTKLFTAALALMRLGADHRFHTRLGADSSIDSEGILRGDLRLIGGGDPNLSGRVLPYEHNGV